MMPDTLLTTMHSLIHLGITTTPRGTFCHYAHFTEEETEAHRSSNSPKITQLVNSGTKRYSHLLRWRQDEEPCPMRPCLPEWSPARPDPMGVNLKITDSLTLTLQAGKKAQLWTASAMSHTSFKESTN